MNLYEFNDYIGRKSIKEIQARDPTSSVEDIFKFDFREMDDDQEHAIVIFCSSKWK